MNIIVPIFPVDYRGILGIVGMVVCIGGMFFVDEMLKWQAASYTYIEATCRPSNEKLHLFVKSIETKQTGPNEWATKLNLGPKAHHSVYHELKWIVLKHALSYEDRMEFCAGKAVYKSQIVDHPKTARITIYEDDEGGYDVDHLNPIPSYHLQEAPKDFFNSEAMLARRVLVGADGQEYDEQDRYDMETLLKEKEILHRSVTEYKRQAWSWHKQAVRFEDVIEHLKGELTAALESKGDFKKGLVQLMLTIREQQLRIEHALKSLKRPTFTVTKIVAMLILGLASLGVFAFVPEARAWISSTGNQFFIIIFGGVALAVYYLIVQRRK